MDSDTDEDSTDDESSEEETIETKIPFPIGKTWDYISHDRYIDKWANNLMKRSDCDRVRLYTEDVAGERTGIIEATGSPGSIEKLQTTVGRWIAKKWVN